MAGPESLFPPGLFENAPEPGPAGLPASLEEIVRHGVAQGFSDVHLGVGEEPRYRNRGEMVTTGWPCTDSSTFERWLGELLSPSQRDTFRLQRELDASHGFGFVRVRINLFEALSGPAMVLRLVPLQIPSLESLGLPPVLQQLCRRPKGLLLVTGPTGSGKSTTLAAMVDWINRSMARHILTIEDPVEFVHQSQRSLVRQREVGQHTQAFQLGLRAALREDPDVILIGEIRDRETLATALEASQTGHLVLGSLHTNSAVRSVERVLGMVPAADQEATRRALAEALVGVIAQGLIRTQTGGRTAFHDILINSEACRDYIQRGDLEAIEQIMERSDFEGMQTSNQALQELVESGSVDANEALAQSPRPSELAQALRGRF